MFYDGHPRAEPGAIVCRVAPSFMRFGNFELPASRGDVRAAARSSSTSRSARDFPELGGAAVAQGSATRALVRARSASAPPCMVAHWMRVGFVHGVMNTDNMSILGLTIDYGPYGWLDDFDPDWTPNTTDAGGRRYRFGAAAADRATGTWCGWPSALCPLIEQTEPLQERALDGYAETYEAGQRRCWRQAGPRRRRRRRRGAARATGARRRAARGADAGRDRHDDLLPRAGRRAGASGPERTDDALLAPLADAYYAPERARRRRARAATLAWLRRYARACATDGTPDAERRARMNAVNPQLRAAQLPRPAGDRRRRAGRRRRWCASCSTCCAAPTTSSPAASASPPSARSGRATAPAARCSPAAPERQPVSNPQSRMARSPTGATALSRPGGD